MNSSINGSASLYDRSLAALIGALSLFVILFHGYVLLGEPLPVAFLLMTTLVAGASLYSIHFGFLILLFSMGVGAWLISAEISSYPTVLSFVIAVAVLCMVIRLVFTRRKLTVKSYHWAMAAFAVIACFGGVLANSRFSVFQPLADYGYLNISTNIWGVPTGSVLGSILEASSTYVAWAGLFFIASQLNWGKEFRRRLITVILILLALNTVAVLCQEFIHPRAFAGADYFHNRRSGLMPEFNTLGHFASMLLVFIPVVAERNLRGVLFGAGILATALFSILYSGSRAPFLLLVVVGLVTGWRLLANRKWDRKQLLIAGTASVVLIVMCAALLFSGILSSVPLVQRLQQQLTDDSSFSKILNARAEMWPNAVAMIGNYPLSGYGPGTYFAEVGNISASIGRPLAVVDNALNLYLNTAAEVGIPALFLFLYSAVYVVFKRKYGAVSDAGGAWRLQYARIVLTSMLLIFILGPHIISAPTAMVFWALCGFIVARSEVADSATPEKSWAKPVAFFALAAIAIAGMYLSDSSLDRYEQWKRYRWHIEANMYPPDSEEDPSFWTGEFAISTSVPTKQYYFIKWRAADPAAAETRPSVEFTWDGNIIDSRVVSDDSWHYTLLDTNPVQPRQRLMTIRTNPAWVPGADGSNDDMRRLGLRIAEMDNVYEPPFSDDGFWPWEDDGERRYQWSRRESVRSVPLFKGPIRFQIRAPHADLASNPVTATIYLNNRMMQQIQISKPAWHTVLIDPAEIPEEILPRWNPLMRGELNGFLVITVDRIWRPSEQGDSSDNRELGVALTEGELINERQ